ncbi:hypothetical protein, partial [Mesotoga prima]|uniref:hypothetical protein n=1 Tax=Mesotoga prima TaxID=1184387 RepID=UPI002FDA5B8C
YVITPGSYRVNRYYVSHRLPVLLDTGDHTPVIWKREMNVSNNSSCVAKGFLGYFFHFTAVATNH